ncbi:MAG: cytochrome-c peroxidase [bacterium]|nr:cytochrome-c peroxidase [bacterium]
MNPTLRGRATVLALLFLAACSQSGSGDPAGETGDPTNPVAPIPGAAELRATLANEGITALPAAPGVSDELFALGQALFFDKELSGNRDVSCATCHWPELGTADDRALPRGVGGVGLGSTRSFGAIVPRNSPAALNAVLFDEVFHDGRVEHVGNNLRTPAGTALTAAMRAAFDPRWELLAAQAMFPVTSRDEMRGTTGSNELANLGDGDFAGIWNGLRSRLLAFTEYQQLFLAAYPGVGSLNELGFEHAANAIAAFEVRAFTRTDSPFERFVNGDDQALTAAEVEGGREFFGNAGCARCHAGSAFTDHAFHNIGLPQFGPGKGDGANGADDFGRERVTGNAGDRYRFRTPTLLNIALTAPYGHAGQYAGLTAMVRHYTDPARRLREYDLAAQVADTALLGTQIDNEAAVLANLSPRLAGPRPFDVDAVVTFLGALTADSTTTLGTTIPTRVPSGLPLR